MIRDLIVGTLAFAVTWWFLDYAYQHSETVRENRCPPVRSAPPVDDSAAVPALLTADVDGESLP